MSLVSGCRRCVEDPETFRRINGWGAVFWIVMVPVSYAMGWLESVTYVSALSIYALVTGHLATFQAAKGEQRQRENE